MDLGSKFSRLKEKRSGERKRLIHSDSGVSPHYRLGLRAGA